MGAAGDGWLAAGGADLGVNKMDFGVAGGANEVATFVAIDAEGWKK